MIHSLRGGPDQSRSDRLGKRRDVTRRHMLEVHNEAATLENAFRCQAAALTAAPLLIDAIRTAIGNEPL